MAGLYCNSLPFFENFLCLVIWIWILHGQIHFGAYVSVQPSCRQGLTRNCTTVPTTHECGNLLEMRTRFRLELYFVGAA